MTDLKQAALDYHRHPVPGKVATFITKPTAGGSRRSREESAEVEMVVSCYRPGDTDDAQQEAAAAAWAMADTLHDHLRVRGNETLGGICREAWISEWSDDDGGYRLTDAGGLITGRATDITITITADTRI